MYLFSVPLHPRGGDGARAPLVDGIGKGLPQVTVAEELPRFVGVYGDAAYEELGSVNNRYVVHGHMDGEGGEGCAEHRAKLSARAGSVGARDSGIGFILSVLSKAASHEVVLNLRIWLVALGIEYANGRCAPLQGIGD